VSWTELLKDIGQYNANVMRAVQPEISRIQIFPSWLARILLTLNISIYICVCVCAGARASDFVLTYSYR
jgi:hypothetical protein